jgi:hypothetical protein
MCMSGYGNTNLSFKLNDQGERANLVFCLMVPKSIFPLSLNL